MSIKQDISNKSFILLPVKFYAIIVSMVVVLLISNLL